MRIPGFRGKRLESAERAKKELGLAVLGELPRPTAGAPKLEAAYGHLFQETLLRLSQGELHRTTLAVTSTREQEGRTSVAANLAIAAARQGRSVLLVDMEARNPLLHRIFGGDFASATPGLVDLLSMAITSPSEVILETSVPRLRLLPVGDTERHDPAIQFSSSRLEHFVRKHAPRLADIVIFDAPNVLSSEAGRHVLSHVDGCIFVVGLGELEASSARKALERLEHHQARVLGGAFLSLGSFPMTQAVPLPGVTLQKSVKTTETLHVVSPTPLEEPINVTPPALSDQTSEVVTKNESDGMSMNAAQKRDDDQTPIPEGGFGVEDLEAVLQGWRRRDTGASTEVVAPAEDQGNVAISLPPLFNVPTEASDAIEANAEEPQEASEPVSEAVPIGIPISFPFLSVATNDDASDKSEPSEKPILTLVEEEVADVVEEAEPEVVAEALVAEAEEEKIIEPEPVVVAADPDVEEPMSTFESETDSTFMPVIPAFPVPVMTSEAPEPVKPVVVEPVAVAPEPIIIPEPVVAAAPTPEPAPYIPPAPSWPVVAPVVTAAPVMAAPAFAPVASAPAPARAALDMQIDIFQTGPGEMTMRAASSNSPATGVPPVSLELAMSMNSMRGMRAITPSSSGGPDQPRIALEAVSTDAPEATRMRLVVGSTHEPALEVVVHNGAGISVRTGTSHEQPAVKLDSQNLPDGGSVTRATLFPARGGQEMVLELRREAVNDGFTDARWKNRLSLFA
jgi:Mrp family chromosome partitioning ATPase